MMVLSRSGARRSVRETVVVGAVMVYGLNCPALHSNSVRDGGALRGESNVLPRCRARNPARNGSFVATIFVAEPQFQSRLLEQPEVDGVDDEKHYRPRRDDA